MKNSLQKWPCIGWRFPACWQFGVTILNFSAEAFEWFSRPVLTHPAVSIQSESCIAAVFLIVSISTWPLITWSRKKEYAASGFRAHLKRISRRELTLKAGISTCLNGDIFLFPHAPFEPGSGRPRRNVLRLENAHVVPGYVKGFLGAFLSGRFVIFGLQNKTAWQ